MVYSQRMIDHPRDLAEQAPPGFVWSCDEKFSALPRKKRQHCPGLRGCKVPREKMVHIVTDEREFPLDETFMRQN
ncbi:hypothetical protein VTI28DRAFT_4458 [Corynascus sepedonium]